jgi:hypothetical protein
VEKESSIGRVRKSEAIELGKSEGCIYLPIYLEQMLKRCSASLQALNER